MPVYDLLGGKSREAAHVYVHADGRDPQEVTENVRAFQEEGYRYIRVQMGGYGGATKMSGFGLGQQKVTEATAATKNKAKAKPVRMVLPDDAPPGAYFDPRAYARNMLTMMEYVRSEVGDEVELLHDVHERLGTINAVQFAKDVEPFKLFFLEDILAPEDLEWFERIANKPRPPWRWANSSTTRASGSP